MGEGFVTPLYRVRLDAPGELERLCPDRPASLDGLAVAREGARAALICQGPGMPPEIYCCDLQTQVVEPLTRINVAVDRLSLGRSEVRRWPSTEDLEIEGQVVYPPDYRAGRAYPTILVIHGGPMGRFRSDLGLIPHQLLARQGYVVLAPNPRGSSGYGEDFLGANYADWGGGRLPRPHGRPRPPDRGRHRRPGAPGRLRRLLRRLHDRLDGLADRPLPAPPFVSAGSPTCSASTAPPTSRVSWSCTSGSTPTTTRSASARARR